MGRQKRQKGIRARFRSARVQECVWWTCRGPVGTSARRTRCVGMGIIARPPGKKWSAAGKGGAAEEDLFSSTGDVNRISGKSAVWFGVLSSSHFGVLESDGHVRARNKSRRNEGVPATKYHIRPCILRALNIWAPHTSLYHMIDTLLLSARDPSPRLETRNLPQMSGWFNGTGFCGCITQDAG